MSKIVVASDTGAISYLSKYMEGDEDIPTLTICNNLPEAKKKLKEYLQKTLEEVDSIKLKDIL